MHTEGMKIARPRQLYTGYEQRNFETAITKR
jgi:citrate synthase